MGRVVWDKGSGLFYEEGIDGPLTTAGAFARIRYNPLSNRYIDDAGRFVPSWVARTPPESERVTFARDAAGNVNAHLGIRYQTVSESSLEGRRIQNNEQVTVRIVYRRADNSVHEVFVSGGLGRTPDLADLIALGRQKADADIRSAAGETYLANKAQAGADMAAYELAVETQIVSIAKL